jgi:ribonucleoside-diphosphate reductase alpha chain
MSKKQLISEMLDPLHQSFDLFNDPFVKSVYEQRYKMPVDADIHNTIVRAVTGVMKHSSLSERAAVFNAITSGVFIPAGRILASAGLDTKSTLQNCYVSCKIEDSIEGIMRAYSESMTTLGRFGGIGIDFTPIRPKGAKVGQQNLESPGVIEWMRMWHEGANHIMQSGHRRGAMMGTLSDHHPDILDFVKAKQTQGELTNFNVSVLVSDKFMKAVADGAMWTLWHDKPRSPLHEKTDIRDCTGAVYVYDQIPARELWELITRSTYKYSEPGVIFIDAINRNNNLWYVEDIRCTNPCGEQPLPPYGACNLGHINLARLVNNPFGLAKDKRPAVNYPALRHAVELAVDFLDRVIDVSEFPLPEQRTEQINKRRIGLGITGLADMLIQLELKYGSLEANALVKDVMREIACTAYNKSAELGRIRGSFPLYEKRYAERGFATKMKKFVFPWDHMRNSLLLTVAPTGTTSIVFGNVSSGIEPNFAWRMKRKVWTGVGEHKEEVCESFITRFWQHCVGGPSNELEGFSYAVTAHDVTVDEHLHTQAAVQQWIDASVTKTVNCPQGMPYEEFVEVYLKAYNLGCKGCTTYVESDIRGSVIQNADQPSAEASSVGGSGASDTSVHSAEFLILDTDQQGSDVRVGVSHAGKRPEQLAGSTIKMKWPHFKDNVYLTVNYKDNAPYEVFIASMDLRNIEWLVTTCLMISRSLRRGDNPQEVVDLLKNIQGASEGCFIGQKYYTSFVQYLGDVLEQDFKKERHKPVTPYWSPMLSPTGRVTQDTHIIKSVDRKVENYAGTCPDCLAPLTFSEGCKKCTSCGYNKCG